MPPSRIAIVDSGVNARHPHVAGLATLTGSFNACDPAGEVFDWLGHGTAVLALIAEQAPQSQLLVVKVFDRALRTNAEVLERGLRWAIRQRVDWVNLSLGTTNDTWRPLLVDLVAEAAALGIQFVSPYRTEDALCFPGSLPGVCGVLSDPMLPRGQSRQENGIYYASPYPKEIPGVPKEHNLHGVSFAVANATASLARLSPPALPSVDPG